MKCATLDARMCIQEASRVLQDERLRIAVLDGDLIAMDVLYHKSCSRDKTRQKTLTRLVKLDAEIQPDSDHENLQAAVRRLSQNL